MAAALLADVLVVIHLAFIVFAALGGLLALHWSKVAWLHVPAMGWSALAIGARWICPLTPWEQQLRLAAGERGYTGGFVAHYLVPLVYPPGMTPTLGVLLAGLLVGGNALLYAFIWKRNRARQQRSST